MLNKKKSVAYLIISLCVIFLFAYLIVKKSHYFSHHEYIMACHSNLKDIYRLSEIFLNEHKNTFPKAWGADRYAWFPFLKRYYETKIYPRSKGFVGFKCGLDKEKHPSSYCFNTRLAGKNYLIQNLDKIVVFYEYKPLHLGNERGSVIFLDGHVEDLTPQELQIFLSEPK